MTQMFDVTISALGEVRDAEGNLISTEPFEGTMRVTHEQLVQIAGWEPVSDGAVVDVSVRDAPADDTNSNLPSSTPPIQGESE